MAKYIRTKDGIYQVTFDGLCYKEAQSQIMPILVEHKNEKGKIEYEEVTIRRELAMGKNHFKKYIIKQADTIKELCDEYVIKDTNGRYTYITNSKPNVLYKNCEIYGAIWTDKGLIYVAKMNEKGELELL